MRTVLFAVLFAICCSTVPAGETVWFRTDGLGRYPDATPVTEFRGFLQENHQKISPFQAQFLRRIYN